MLIEALRKHYDLRYHRRRITMSSAERHAVRMFFLSISGGLAVLVLIGVIALVLLTQ